MSAQESKKKKRPRDLNRLAYSLVQDSTEEPERFMRGMGDSTKNPHAVELGRLGGMKGGRVRADKLTPEQRSEIARKAAMARWKKPRTSKDES